MDSNLKKRISSQQLLRNRLSLNRAELGLVRVLELESQRVGSYAILVVDTSRV